MLSYEANMIDNFYNTPHYQIIFETAVQKPSLEEAFRAITPENSIEEALLSNRDWKEGASLGKPRPGHPEGEVIFHILEVLANVEKWCLEHRTSQKDRSKLRWIALIHDTFKHKVDRRIPEEGENHHAAIARRFAEEISIGDPEVLEVIEHHDDAYSLWLQGEQGQDSEAAKENLIEFARRLENKSARIDLYRAFYWCDNHTGDKTSIPYIWFDRIISSLQDERGASRPLSHGFQAV